MCGNWGYGVVYFLFVLMRKNNAKNPNWTRLFYYWDHRGTFQIWFYVILCSRGLCLSVKYSIQQVVPATGWIFCMIERCRQCRLFCVLFNATAFWLWRQRWFWCFNCATFVNQSNPAQGLLSWLPKITHLFLVLHTTWLRLPVVRTSNRLKKPSSRLVVLAISRLQCALSST